VSGAVGGVLAAVACIWWTLRSLARVSERALLAGQVSLDDPRPAKERGKRLPAAAAALAVIAMLLLAGTATGRIEPAGGFFGAGAVLLVVALVAARAVLVREPRRADGLGGRWPLLRLGMRNASHRPGRSLLAIAVIACATFIIVSVDAFRRGGQADTGRQSGVGGYGLLVETLLPVAHDPNSSEGREALNLFNLDGGGAGSAASGGADRGTRIEPFRLRPGDDASCLNLYEPRNPRILAPRDSFLDEGRFAFGSSLATTAEDIANPWRLLRRVEPDGAIPVIADANSMTYVLHRALGEDLVLTVGGRDVRLRFVAALQDSLFQGELLMAPANFVRLFPDHEGTRVFLVESRREPAQLASTFEEAWVDLGGDAIPTVERLAQFHRVENTYLSTFQTLGGLGLLLGTIGLATVLLRNVLERRKELALLGAVGYRSQHVRQMVLAENALLLLSGLVIGTLCAGLAILPAVAARGGRVPLTSGAALLLFGVFLTGLLSSVVALRAATRTPLLAALRSE
jgi:putative ABC transport system permease protein